MSNGWQEFAAKSHVNLLGKLSEHGKISLTTKVKSVAIRQGELVTAALVSNLECHVGQLEHDRDHTLEDNKILEVTCKEVSETLGKIK